MSSTLSPNGQGWRGRAYSSWICIWRGQRDDDDWRRPSRQPISPLVGEMSGRTEGGAVPPASQRLAAATSKFFGL
ncbi:hypothetical protein EN827_24245 [Mesorhizobium sp. M1D.F.Ca.ET.184.01.1.1]|nr:hypothetical protein EN874_025870 [Mesorhizobium sp. M1D.F.Ca.ET.231.01.1.1]TGP27690.1 hypothetical protein EN877_25160 [Mesorhizobium sp. M1D.F.Ca.ET.234.01.1.1]TGS42040.1 hypothetical protein EN827_24245 [Mesorhizobium sp. M1D.F.Ca.ET.184.01.1.1]TGS59392.1 hypothetical protein EN826_024245 [Mesorhizobium sp. M1D.F.Ca.ET.183.01.1.1]